MQGRFVCKNNDNAIPNTEQVGYETPGVHHPHTIFSFGPLEQTVGVTLLKKNLERTGGIIKQSKKSARPRSIRPASRRYRGGKPPNALALTRPHENILLSEKFQKNEKKKDDTKRCVMAENNPGVTKGPSVSKKEQSPPAKGGGRAKWVLGGSEKRLLGGGRVEAFGSPIGGAERGKKSNRGRLCQQGERGPVWGRQQKLKVCKRCEGGEAKPGERGQDKKSRRAAERCVRRSESACYGATQWFFKKRSLGGKVGYWSSGGAR